MISMLVDATHTDAFRTIQISGWMFFILWDRFLDFRIDDPNIFDWRQNWLLALHFGKTPFGSLQLVLQLVAATVLGDNQRALCIFLLRRECHGENYFCMRL
jgi:hypothetical protein